MLKPKVIKALAKIRTVLQSDGGDVELVAVDEKAGSVKIKFHGACVGCPMAELTLDSVITQELKKQVKGIKKVSTV